MNASEINKLVYQIISESDFDLAEQFLVSPETQRHQSVWLLLKLMENCLPDQAAFVGYLLNEFIPEGTTVGAVELLRRHEFKMYRRLKLRRGIERSLRRYLSRSPEGRALIRSIGNGGLLEP